MRKNPSVNYWSGRWESNPRPAFRKCVNLLTDHHQFGRIWAQNSGLRSSPTLSTALR
jgi:hypothetical protein